MKRDSELYHQVERSIEKQEYAEFIKASLSELAKLKAFYVSLNEGDLKEDIANIFNQYQSECLTQCIDADITRILAIKLESEVQS